MWKIYFENEKNIKHNTLENLIYDIKIQLRYKTIFDTYSTINEYIVFYVTVFFITQGFDGSRA